MENEVEKAMKVIKNAMESEGPSELGSYAHSWHCNIAMAVYDNCPKDIGSETAHAIGNDAATQFMKLCFGVNTTNEQINQG